MSRTPPPKRRGRPRGATPPLRTLTIRLDPDTEAALLKLEAALGPGVKGARSDAVRNAILREAARLDGAQP